MLNETIEIYRQSQPRRVVLVVHPVASWTQRDQIPYMGWVKAVGQYSHGLPFFDLCSGTIR